MAKTKTASKAAGNVIQAQAPDNWQAQSDLRTLHEAHQIKQDPKRHSAAIAHAKTMLQAAQQPVQVPPPEDETETPVG